MSYEKNKNELYAEKWLKENGFEIINCKQFVSKTKYIIKKEKIEMKFDLPFCVTDIRSYMEFCKEQFEMYCLLKAKI